MIDILYLTHNRREFTGASLAAMRTNTNWGKVRRILFYDDMSSDGAQRLSAIVRPQIPRGCQRIYFRRTNWDGPVSVMKDYLAWDSAAPVFAKIDSDTMLPPGWLDACLGVIEAHPELDLLGIEPPASRTPAPWANPSDAREIPPERLYAHRSGYAPCDSIGGIGLMRTRAFRDRAPMRPHATYGGFTDWQLAHPEVRKGWIVPPLQVFLLDRLPMEPWASLSREYIARGWQRPWTNYTMADRELWSWWKPQVMEAA